MRESVMATWEKFLPILKVRTRYNAPQIYLEFEFLYHEMKRIRDNKGYPATGFGRNIP